MNERERVALWRARISVAQKRQDVFYDGQDGVRGAQFAIDVARGKSKPDWWSEQDAWVHVGKLKAAVRAAVPTLIYNNPRFRVYPSMRDEPEIAYARARAKTMWLNHVWKESHAQTHVRVGVQNAFFTLGAAKAGYLCDWEDSKDRGVFARDEDGLYVRDAAGDPVLERGKFLTDKNGEVMRDEYGIPLLHPGKVTKEKWFVEVTDPKMLLFDVESGPDFFQHRFLIEIVVRPLEDAKNDPRFKAAARKRLTATETVRGQTQRKSVFEAPSVTDGDNAAVERDEERVRYYNIYDFQNDQFLVLAESGSDVDDSFLLEGPMPAGTEHGPLRFLKYTEDIGAEWYPIPDAIDMALVNQEYNITRSQGMIHREHTKTRYLELPGAFDDTSSNAEEERSKWKTGGDATLIKVTGGDKIMPAPKAQLDGSFFQAIPNIALDFNEVGGMPGESRGVADAESATQASILASGAEIRNSDRRDNQVQTWLCEIARMLLMSGQANAERDSVTMEKIKAETGVLPFRDDLTREEMLGEFEVEVEVGSTLNKSDPRTQAALREFLTAISQNPWVATIDGLIEYYLDSLNLPSNLAASIREAAMRQQAVEQGPPQAPPGATTQTIEQMLGGITNNQAGVSTGAPIN